MAMTMKRTFAWVFCLLLAAAVGGLDAQAQSNEIALTVGGYFPLNSPVPVGHALAIEGNVAHRLVGAPMIAAYLEVPITGTLTSSVTSAGLLSSASYSALFITPGLKLKLGAELPISPYLAAGGGLARYSKSANLAAAAATDTVTNTGVFDVGGGVDMKIAPFLGLRAEVRDFYSGSPALSLSSLKQKQQSLVATAGLVVRF